MKGIATTSDEVTDDTSEEVWKTASTRESYASFGDKGVTASVGAYGAILRICYPAQILHDDNPVDDGPESPGNRSSGSERLDNGSSHFLSSADESPISMFKSKILCLEYSESEAYLVTSRARNFLRNAENPNSGFGLRLGERIEPEQPTVEFLNNRWPTIKYETVQGFSVTVHLWCKDCCIVQQLEIDKASGPDEIDLILDMQFAMQGLDYTLSLENMGKEETAPEESVSQRGNCILFAGKHEDIDVNQGQIGVLVGLFKDQEPHSIPEHGQFKPPETSIEYSDAESLPDSNHPHSWSIPFRHKFEDKTSVQYTATFEFRMDSSNTRSSPPSERPFADSESGTGESQPYSERILWHCDRNLEHILSVCSIPLYFKPLATYDPSTTRGPGSNPPEEQTSCSSPVDKTRRIALTCGDFGDHRVSISGSYFAFSYMLEMYKRLSNSPGKEQLCKRIHETCKGHLEWVFGLNPNAACSANVWIDGKCIELTGLTDLPSDNPAIMPYHIMKATEYVEVFEGLHDMFFVCSKLLKLCKQWFSQLKSTKNIRTPTWQHTVSSDIPIYRLSDHILIWKTLKGVEDLISQVKSTHGHTSNPDSPDGFVLDVFLTLERLISTLKAERFQASEPWFTPEKDQIAIPFNSEDVRRENLKRFTVKNDVFNRRMLSVTRSAIETRFLLHSRDTVLCYGILWGFFEGQSELLKEMLKIQIQHDDDLCDEVAWKDPLRYGLALLLSRERCQLERIHSAQEIDRHARKVLLHSSSANGLFPGRLSDDKQGTVFEEEIDRDFYFHVGFEIPYILLRCAYPSETPPLFPAFEHMNAIHIIPPQEAYNDSGLQNNQSRQIQVSPQPRVVSAMLKKQNPYAAFFDVNKIVDVQDEWLFKDPDFLEFVPPQEPQERKIISDKAWEAFGLDDPPELSWEAVDAPRFLERFGRAHLYYRLLRLKRISTAEVSALVLDICKTRKKKLRPDEKSSLYRIPMEDHRSELKWILLRKRTLDESKKRLINIKFPTWDLGVTCYLATPERDRSSLASFIQRHGNIKASFFHDDVVIGFNTWTTEFHCRSYRAVRKGSPEWKMLEAKGSFGSANARPELQCSRKLGYKRCRTLGTGFYIVDDVFSLMMVGDWCDRYWTCHVLETSTTNSGLFEDNWRDKNPSFPQRKVLELILFNHVLGNVHRSTKDILNKVEQDPQSSSSELSEELFSTTSFKDKRQELLDEIFQVLRILKDSIEGVRGLIDDWKQRESSQGRERPRWTRSDEQKYRKVIQTQTNELVKHDREVNLLLSNIDFLISLVNNEKSLSQARDVTRFTYATVFFLPVGLAVSIFSISGAPNRTSILQMVITAIVALSVTVAVLWYVMKAPASKYFRGLNIDGLVQAFKPEQNDEMTTKIQEKRNSVSTVMEESPISSHRSLMKSLRHRLAALPGLRQADETRENGGDSVA